MAIPIHAKQQPPGYLGQWSSYEYQFRVVENNYPGVKRVSFATAPDIAGEKTHKFDAEIRSNDLTSKEKDIYSALVKLDDLRKRGIFTEDEFETQKKKLLRNT